MPGDKSISHRALLISALAEGTSRIQGLSDAADPRSTANCLRALGVDVQVADNETVVVGKGLRGFTAPTHDLDAGNSGTSMRLLTGILAGQKFNTAIVGDDSLCRRPMRRVADPLRSMGAEIELSASDTAPINIYGRKKLKGIDYTLPVPSGQVKSALLFAGLLADGTTTIRETIQTRDHTERMLGLRTLQEGDRLVTAVEGGAAVPFGDIVIPGDFSAAAFFIVAALITKRSELFIQGVGINPTRAAMLDVLRKAGAAVELHNQRTIGGEPLADLLVRSSDLRGTIRLEGDQIPQLIDEIPILAVSGLFAEGFRLRNATELRTKESDRIEALVRNLRALGNDVEEYGDGFAFQSKKGNIGTDIQSFGDHRIAMAFGIAGLVIPGVCIQDSECVSVSFPGFWGMLNDIARSK